MVRIGPDFVRIDPDFVRIDPDYAGSILKWRTGPEFSRTDPANLEPIVTPFAGSVCGVHMAHYFLCSRGSCQDRSCKLQRFGIWIMHFRPLGVSVEHPLFTRKMLGLGYIYKPSCHIGHESERWRWRNAGKRRNLGNTTWPSANLAFLWFNGNGNQMQPGKLPARFSFEGYYGFDVGQRSTLTRFSLDLKKNLGGTYKSIAFYVFCRIFLKKLQFAYVFWKR